ncbi:unnamed protein product [Lupinus luteus]|uniref:X8 domain-containing protein n=1 Tax=Lupinus luteus TaxID=3873 RepID=A0AAV1YB73_LUPLU
MGALYCICQDGAGIQALQKAIDYACGNGADCTSIQQNGPCYLPNTVKDHCNYAVNSYYQMEQLQVLDVFTLQVLAPQITLGVIINTPKP